MLNSRIFQMSIKQFKLLYSMHRSKNFFQKGVGWYDRGIMLFAKVRVGKEVQGLYFGYFYWVSLKDFGGGGDGATPNLIAQFKYDSLPTQCSILEETNLVRSPSFEKEIGRVIVYYNILQERTKKDNLLTSAIIRNAQF